MNIQAHIIQAFNNGLVQGLESIKKNAAELEREKKRKKREEFEALLAEILDRGEEELQQMELEEAIFEAEQALPEVIEPEPEVIEEEVIPQITLSSLSEKLETASGRSDLKDILIESFELESDEDKIELRNMIKEKSVNMAISKESKNV